MIQFCTPVKDNHVDGLTIVKPPAFETAINILLEQSKQKCAGYLNIRLDLPHRPRTTGWKSQNHHLRGHARQLCGYTGFSMSEMMQIIKEDTPSWPIDYKTIRGKTRLIYASEADISIEIASEAIEMCHVYAAENGWILKEESE